MDENGAFLPCWLPYAANSDGDCLAYDSDNIGWYNNGQFTRGGSEILLPKFNRNTQEFRTQSAYPEFTTKHIAADKTVAIGGAACVLVIGGFFMKRRGVRKNKGGGELKGGIAMQQAV